MGARWPRGARGALVPGVLAVAGVVVLVVAIGRQQPAPPSPVAAAPSSSPPTAVRAAPVPAPSSGQGRARTPDLDDPVRGPILREAAPVRLEVPRLGLRSPLVRLGLERGELEVPGDPATAGWYTGAPAPGALGPAVVAGHVTWAGRPAVFFRLGELRPGDRVSVRRADHRTAVFAVRRVHRFPKDRFPTGAVYGPIDHAGLRLVTCGGRYDEHRGRFADNVVVFADLVAVRRP